MIKFERSDLTKEKRQWTPRMIGAAKRALKKELYRSGLFGEELMRFKSVEERIQQIDNRRLSFSTSIRSYDAQLWVKSRKFLRLMPKDIQDEILCFWNKSNYPKKAVYFASLIWQIQKNPNYIKDKEKPWFPTNWEEAFKRIDLNK